MLLLMAAALFTLPGDCMSPAEAELVQRVNDYRSSNGLGPVTPARWLSTTAQWHMWDRVNNPTAVGGSCNPHSWSNSPPAGINWIGMCYTPDHAQATQMWGKPRQISAGAYSGNGYELTADCGCAMTANQALLQWQGSPAHNDVILQRGVWSGVQFTGIGVGITDGYAALWFGDGGPNGGLPFPCDLFSNGFE